MAPRASDHKDPKSKKKTVDTVILSVGGSLIVPEDIDSAFLQALKRCLSGYVKQGFRFVIVCGGGKTARVYQRAASRMATVSQEDLDWIGLQATYLNAQLVRSVLEKDANPAIVTDPSEAPRFKRGCGIVVAGGWKPGRSTDTAAVLLAEVLGAKKVVNLSNIDFVYDKDPNKYKDAKALKDVSWKEFRALIPKSWDAGMSSPFDPVASKRAEKEKMEVVIINGKKLAQFEHYLNDRPFKGTRIRS